MRFRLIIELTTAALFISCVPLLIQGTYAQAGPPQETPQHRDARMAWWREAKFGMFIHWGSYCVAAGRWQDKDIPGIGEWIMHSAKIPVADYEKLASQFNPSRFDANEWVRLAKEAGMKYIVITSKHHEGFAMFRTKASSYNIYDATPFKRDPLKELATACRKNGIKLGFYYSQAQDWHHPGGAAFDGHWDKAQDGSMDDYIKNIAAPEIRELLTNYGRVAILWWDTPADMTKERADTLLPLLKLQPGIITNDRLGVYPGDYATPEQFIPGTGGNRDWETCMTMNDTWGYKSTDNNWKSGQTLIRNLIDIASKGGNYLLNVGPNAQGEIPVPSMERLKEVGRWMKLNGESIYGTKSSPFRRLDFDGRCTAKGKRLYLHVFSWPEGGIRFYGLKTPIKSAGFLADGAKADFRQMIDRLGMPVVIIKTPARPDPDATVVVLDFDRVPEIENHPLVLQPGSDGSYRLRAFDASVAGSTARYEGNGEDGNIGYWTNKDDYVSWNLLSTSAGEYRVEITYACPPDYAGSAYSVGMRDSGRINAVVTATGDWSSYKAEEIGRIRLAAGMQELTVKVSDMPHSAVMNLKTICLIPVF